MALDGSGSVIDSAWDGTLNKGSFSKFPITISLDKPPSSVGTISVGGKSYPLRSDDSDAAGPDCARIYTDSFVEIDCLIPMGKSFNPKASGDAADTVDLGSTFLLKQLDAELSDGQPAANLTKRLVGPNVIPICEDQSSTNLVGNGNPHQNYYNEQISVSTMQYSDLLSLLRIIPQRLANL